MTTRTSRQTRINVRLTDDEKKAVEFMAKAAGLNVSRYIIRLLGLPDRPASTLALDQIGTSGTPSAHKCEATDYR